MDESITRPESPATRLALESAGAIGVYMGQDPNSGRHPQGDSALKLPTVEIQATQEGSVVRLVLSGKLNEAFDIDRFLETIGQVPHVVLNTQGITDINSSGVRNWLLLLDKLPSGRTVEFEAVSVPLVEQANMILNCLTRGRVTSFMAPYFCYQCQESVVRLISATDPYVAGREHRPPPFQCSRCGTELTFDDDATEYFTFLGNGTSSAD